MWLPLLLSAAAAAAQEVTPVQMPRGVLVRDAAYAAVDGDGLEALVISPRGPALELRIHLRRADGDRPFVAQPDYLLSPVWTDVIAFAVADVHPDPGAEVVLLTPSAAWAWRPRAGEKDRAVKLIDCAFLWQLPFDHGPVHWPWAIVDLDGDGRSDLALPEPEGYRVAFQRAPGVFDPPQELDVPALPAPDKEVSRQGLLATDRQSARKMRDRMELQISSGEGISVESLRAGDSLVDVTDRVPAPQWSDWDADGDLDLIVRTQRWVHVWLQGAGGKFHALPDLDLVAPVVADQARRLEVSYSAHVVDLDADHRADCVIFSGDRRSKDVRTQVQFFRQAEGSALFPSDGLPDQLLVLAGFAGGPHFDDVDGDGYPDMLVGTLRPDLLDSLRGGDRTSLDVEFYLYRSDHGSFPRKPDLAYRTEVQAEGLRPGRAGFVARMFGDASGDGLADLLLRDRADRLRVMLTRPSRGGQLSIYPEPLWELRIAPDSTILVGPSRGPRAAPDLLVLEPEQVLLVRFS